MWHRRARWRFHSNIRTQVRALLLPDPTTRTVRLGGKGCGGAAVGRKPGGQRGAGAERPPRGTRGAPGNAASSASCHVAFIHSACCCRRDSTCICEVTFAGVAFWARTRVGHHRSQFEDPSSPQRDTLCPLAAAAHKPAFCSLLRYLLRSFLKLIKQFISPVKSRPACVPRALRSKTEKDMASCPRRDPGDACRGARQGCGGHGPERPSGSLPFPGPTVGKSGSSMEESVTLDNGGFAGLELNSRHLNVKNTFSKKNGTR